MKMFGVILVALSMQPSESLGKDLASRSSLNLRKTEPQVKAVDPPSRMVAQVLVDADEQPKSTRRSKYDVPAGEKRLDGWCSGPNVHDPACSANPTAMSISEEIEAVMRHMMCKRHPDTCKAPPEEKKSPSAEKAKPEAPPEEKKSPPAEKAKPEEIKQPEKVPGVNEFSKAVKEKYGDSDKSFENADKDHNGEVSQSEFEGQCNNLGIEKKPCDEVMKELGGEKDQSLSQKDYKDAVGPTPAEVARRMREKYPSPDDAFEAGDVDKDGSLSELELYEQCALVTTAEACKNLQESLGQKGGISKEAFETWMKTGAAGSPKPDTINPEESSEKLTGLVNKLENITESLDKQDKLDPELGKALGEMVKNGKAAADALDKVAKLGPAEGDKELGKVIDQAEALDDAVFKFQTEVHPHGYKWWRYRWEYAFVEANILNLLVFTTMLLYAGLNYVNSRMSKFDGSVEHEYASVVHLYHRIVTRGMHELNVLGAIAFIIWALEECGVFLWIVKFLPARTNPVNAVIELTGQGEEMSHWPTTDHHVIFALRSVNCHLFLAMLLYYLLMYHITLGAVAILEQFMRHENSEFYQAFIEEGSQSEDLRDKPKELGDRADAVYRVLTNKGPLGKALSSQYLLSLVFGHFVKPEDFDNFKQYIAKHVQYHEGFEELHELIPVAPLYPYLVQKLHLSLNSMICIDWRVWLLVQAVLVMQSLIHYFMHIAVVELIPFNLVVGSLILAFQFVWTRRRAAYVVDPANQVSSQTEGRSEIELQARERLEQWLLWLEQLTLFFLCFSAARLFFSSFFWSDYFRLSCCLLVLFLGAYLIFAFIGALAIPMFLVMMAVPPHVTKEDRELMKKVYETHKDAGVQSMSASSFGTAEVSRRKRRCATGMAII